VDSERLAKPLAVFQHSGSACSVQNSFERSSWRIFLIYWFYI
jgi:hypothetical protein